MSNADPAPRRFSPPRAARRYGVAHEKILAWIKSGELRAINVATRPTGRPRYLIDEADLLAFEAKRSNSPTPAKKRRSRKQSEVPQYV